MENDYKTAREAFSAIYDMLHQGRKQGSVLIELNTESIIESRIKSKEGFYDMAERLGVQFHITTSHSTNQVIIAWEPKKTPEELRQKISELQDKISQSVKDTDSKTLSQMPDEEKIQILEQIFAIVNDGVFEIHHRFCGGHFPAKIPVIVDKKWRDENVDYSFIVDAFRGFRVSFQRVAQQENSTYYSFALVMEKQ